MFKSLMFSLAAAGTIAATSASAFDFTVVMEEGAFNPEITYVVPGDTVTFLNNTDAVEEATSGLETWKLGNLETWKTGELNVNESYILEITSETKLTFSYASDIEKTGALSFEPAPLCEVSEDDEVVGGSDGLEVTN